MNWRYRVGKVILAIPVYLWIILFIFLPFFLILQMSLTVDSTSPVGLWVRPFVLQIQLSFEHFYDFLTQYFYLSVIITSLKIAAITTIGSAVLGFLMAYAIFMSPKSIRNVLIVLVSLPLFTSFLLRVYAWMGLLSTHGLINQALLLLGLIQTPFVFLGTTFAVCVGTIYCYLPFMVLPIYVQLEHIDPTLLEAASDLGARPMNAFFYVTLPLAIRGVLMGCILVFIPVMGEFVIPELLGNSEILTIGRALQWEFFNQHDLSMTSTIALASILFLVLPTIFFQMKRP